jgi:hypothetical protein
MRLRACEDCRLTCSCLLRLLVLSFWFLVKNLCSFLGIPFFTKNLELITKNREELANHARLMKR